MTLIDKLHVTSQVPVLKSHLHWVGDSCILTPSLTHPQDNESHQQITIVFSEISITEILLTSQI